MTGWIPLFEIGWDAEKTLNAVELVRGEGTVVFK
jgi:hypothetical protein